ncbi:Protein ccc1 [Sporothrix bragantina]|uniref:Protein ccc1 n=1 Tax=Sporothrix bragantina TaxID=671064 RepID=A0ABP0B214_9PEZI
MAVSAETATVSPTITGRATSEPPIRPCADSASVHGQTHSDHGDVMRDMIIGFSDGVTVPFALTAGLSSLGSTHLVIVGGLAELFSGAISMGLGAYLAAVTERQHYLSEEARERQQVVFCSEFEREKIYNITSRYSISRSATRPVVDELSHRVDDWIRFMMDFELKLKKPAVSRAWISAVTMGFSYLLGGLVPMIPYFAMSNAVHALYASIGITIVILLAFGYTKSWVTLKKRRSALLGAVQTLIIGSLAAAASYGIVRGVDSRNPVIATSRM